MNKITQIFQNIGVGEHSAIIYLSLLNNGKSNIAEIATNTGFHRMQIYRLLPLLVEQGYIYESKIGKRKYYSPASPEKVQEDYENQIKDNSIIFQNLKEQFQSQKNTTNVVFKKGRTGIKNVYNDIVNTLNDSDVFYRITSETDLDKIKSYYQPYNYIEKRDQKEIERMIITSQKAAKQKIPKLEREIKIIPDNSDMFEDNISFTIYGNKISLIDFNTESSIILESEEFSHFFQKIFKMFYKKL